MHGRQRYSGGGGFPGLTPMVKRLMIANAVVFLVQTYYRAQTGTDPLLEYGAVRLDDMIKGYFWQPFTYMWLHADLSHVFFNMFALWMFGGSLEQVWGSQRFLRFYLVCGVGAGFVILLWNLIGGDWLVPTLGASGAVYGILMAFSLSWPDRTIMLLFPPIPMKAIWFIPFLFVIQYLMNPGANISHAGHLGGVLVAAILMRKELQGVFGTGFGFGSLRYKWHRYRMRGRLRAVRKEEWDKRRQGKDDDDRPTYH